jgi:hypothetical protein
MIGRNDVYNAKFGSKTEVILFLDHDCNLRTSSFQSSHHQILLVIHPFFTFLLL